jgi:amidophosphoribosyltransferase
MCGVFGVFNVPYAAALTVTGLHGLQHRAHDYAGIASSDGKFLHRRRGKGLARQVFTAEVLSHLPGKAALGHTRYPTSEYQDLDDEHTLVQPIIGRYNGVRFAVAHNGQITNEKALSEHVPKSSLSTPMDTEYIRRLLEANVSGDIEADLARVFSLLKGSYSLGILFPKMLIAVRDPRGSRPLSIGKIGEDGYCISSETCPFPNVDAEHVCDVDPGTMVFITKKGMRTVRFAEPREKKCRFEAIYFAHPASVVFGEQVAQFRMELGRALEKHAPVKGGADLVIPVPDSANFIAMGYGESGRSGAYFPLIYRSHYVGRTFIAATQAKRDEEVSSKFTFSRELILGKRIVLVDDSIVRGTTLPKIVEKLKKLGAKAIHVRIGSPEIEHPCRYGINLQTYEELISARHSPTELRRKMKVTSLKFLSLPVLKTLSPRPRSFCYACQNGKYWD